MSALQKSKAKFAKYNTKIVAIAAQSPKTLQKLKQRLSLTFPVLSDKPLNAIKKYGVEHKGSGISLPAIFMVGPTGRIEWRQIAPSVRKRPKVELLLKIAKSITAQHKPPTGKAAPYMQPNPSSHPTPRK